MNERLFGVEKSIFGHNNLEHVNALKED